MKRLLVPAAVLLFAGLVSPGCATTNSEAASTVQEADEKTVAGCTFVGNVAGTSAIDGVTSTLGVRNAKLEATGKAAKLGATHVVWSSVEGTLDRSSVRGRAYKCPGAVK